MRSRAAGTRVVVLTTTGRDILRAIEAGACGCLLQGHVAGEPAAVVRAAGRGETVLLPCVTSTLVRRVRTPAPAAPSAREAQALRLVAEGRTNADIGRALFISEATVRRTRCGCPASWTWRTGRRRSPGRWRRG